MAEGTAPRETASTTMQSSAATNREVEDAIDLLSVAFKKAINVSPLDESAGLAFPAVFPSVEVLRRFEELKVGSSEKLLQQSLDARDEIVSRLKIENKLRASHSRLINSRTIWTVLSSLALGIIGLKLIEGFGDFSAAYNSLVNHSESGFNLLISPAYAASVETKPLTPNAKQKIILVYVIYGLIGLALAAALGLMYQDDKDKQENGKDISKIVLGFLAGAYTGHFDT